MNERPSVSILVPVYNAGEYIGRFLDSAVLQTLENIEIICVNNESTDDSLEIVKRYQERYPEKIFVYSTGIHFPTAAGARNVALKHARGEYIYWCDSDDIIQCTAMEALYTVAKDYNCDMVCGSAIIVELDEEGNMKTSELGKKTNQKVSNETAILSGVEFWQRLVKKSLLEQVGDIPEDIIFDDVAYMPVVHSYANNIRFLNYPVYYYFKSPQSTVGSPTVDVCRGSIKADMYALEHCNPKYVKVVERMVANRIRYCMEDRWQCFDIFVEWARKMMPRFAENEYIRADRALFSKMNSCTKLREVMPNIIYLDGFSKEVGEERIFELKEGVFSSESEIVILTSQNCDLESNEYVKRCYILEKYELVAGYFALKNIYEQGGMYIHNKIKILNYFSYYKYHNAFFCLIDKNTYSDSLFGSPADNEVIADLLDTFSDNWDKKGNYISISERIKIILTAKYNIPLDGKERLFQYPVSVISPDLCVVDTRFGSMKKRVVCEHDFSELSKDADYVTMKRSTLETILNNASSSFVPGSAVKVQGNNSREKALEQELREIKDSNLWKLMQKLKKIGDGPSGPFLKKVFHGFVKFKNKHKKK